MLTQVCQCFIQRIRQLITHKSPKSFVEPNKLMQNGYISWQIIVPLLGEKFVPTSKMSSTFTNMRNLFSQTSLAGLRRLRLLPVGRPRADRGLLFTEAVSLSLLLPSLTATAGAGEARF